jgi:hypothetical protein
MGTKNLTQVLKDMKLGVALEPKCCMSLESGNLGNANVPREFLKYEATKRIGCADMKSALRFMCIGPKRQDG